MSQKITYVTLLADEKIHPEFERALKEVEKEFGKTYPLYIGDEEVFTDETFVKTSPIDTRIIMGHFQKANRKNIQDAIDKAKKSFEIWGELEYKERIKIFRKVADLLEENKFKIAAYICYEVGKTRLEALAEVYEAMDAIKYYCKLLRRKRRIRKEDGNSCSRGNML